MDDSELTEDVSRQAIAAEVLTQHVTTTAQLLTPDMSDVKVRPKKSKGGRPKGRPNNVTLEIRQAATRLVSDPIYWRKLRADLRKRKVHPQVEVTLLAYAFGKPVDRLEVGRAGDFSRMSDDELVAQLDRTLAELKPKALRRA